MSVFGKMVMGALMAGVPSKQDRPLGEPQPMTPEAREAFSAARTALRPLADRAKELEQQHDTICAEWHKAKDALEAGRKKMWDEMYRSMPELEPISFKVSDDGTTYRRYLEPEQSAKPKQAAQQPDWAKEMARAIESGEEPLP